MRREVLALSGIVLTVVASFVAGRASAGDEPKPEQPKTVKAMRCRVPVAGDVGPGTVSEELWFPEAKVACSVLFDPTRIGPKHARASRSDQPPLWFAGLSDGSGIVLKPRPNEEVQVSQEILQRVLDLADASARAERLSTEVAKQGLEAGVFREAISK